MAEEKLTIVDVRKAIAHESGVDESTAGTFLTALIENITQGLKSDKQVKISGLGTFKLQWVEPRRSVNISTGESIIIEGYNKLGFSPEPGLRDAVNAPFSTLETLELDEDGKPIGVISSGFNPMQKLDEQALEIKDILADIGQGEEGQRPKEKEETKSQEEGKEEVQSEEGQKTKEEEKTEKKEPVKPLKPFRPWLVALITILTFCLLLIGGYFYLQHKVEEWADSLNGKVEKTTIVKEDTAKENDKENVIEVTEPAAPAEDVQTETKPEEAQPEEKPQEVQKKPKEPTPTTAEKKRETIEEFFQKPDYSQTKAVVTVNAGSRLAWIAKKQYGRKDFWVFIYDANRDVIKNPANVVVGTELRIPKLPDYIMHPADEEELRAHTKSLEEKFLK